MTANRKAAWSMGAAGPFLKALNTGGNAGWRDFAVCAETDPEVFFPTEGNPATDARQVCAQCFVRRECLDYALADTSLQGVWGGTTYRERRVLRRGRAA